MKEFSGIFFLLLGPSGVGKGTIISALKEAWSQSPLYTFPITATTRLPREGEKDGEHYFFMEKEAFVEGIEKDDFIEHAIVHGENYYGLPKQEVFTALENGVHVIRELDIQGLWNLQKIIPKENLFSIFILPPNMKTLEKRIRGRSSLPEEEIERRLATAAKEIAHAKECDAVITSEEGKVKESVIAVKNRIIREAMLKREEE